MKNSNKLLKKALYITTILLGLSVGNVFAQGAPGDGGPEPTPDPDPTEIPIDGGASLLLAGGVAYGLKKLRDRRKAR